MIVFNYIFNFFRFVILSVFNHVIKLVWVVVNKDKRLKRTDDKRIDSDGFD